jgi:hypothetical protein
MMMMQFGRFLTFRKMDPDKWGFRFEPRELGSSLDATPWQFETRMQD